MMIIAIEKNVDEFAHVPEGAVFIVGMDRVMMKIPKVKVATDDFDTLCPAHWGEVNAIDLKTGNLEYVSQDTKVERKQNTTLVVE